MRPGGFTRQIARAVLFLLVTALLVCPIPLHADQAQYFYDELGRLVGVVDSQGNTAVYVYDEVGNLLAIQRFTTGAAQVARGQERTSAGAAGSRPASREGKLEQAKAPRSSRVAV